jgi:transcription initiation factor TFIIB
MGGLGEDLRRAATERLKYLVEGLLVRFGPETPILAAVPSEMTRMKMMALAHGIDEEMKKMGAARDRAGSVSHCPECGSDQLVEDYDQGELICQACGLVLTDHALNRGPEWRAFTKEEKDERGRVGIPTSYSIHDKGLSTVIDRVNRDAYGRQLPLSTRLQMLKLRKWQIRTRVHSSADRNLAQAMAELDRLTDKLHIPAPIKERAAVVYRKALDSGLVRGRSIAAIAAAALYAACRSSETPRTLKEVSSASRIRKKDVARCYRLLLRELDIKMPVEDPVRCISKIANRVGIATQTERRGIKILEEAKRKGIVAGKDPMGLAAAALYVACVLEGERKTQKEIAEVANVTEVTVRNRYKGLKDALGLNI